MENELEGKANNIERGGEGGGGMVRSCWVEVLLRILALTLKLIAAIIVGVDKQTKVVPIKLISILPPLNIPITAQWKHLSAFVYFVAANGVACSYAAISLLHWIITNNKRSSSTGAIFDMLVAALLFSSNGAAAANGLMGYQGNSHVRSNKVCNVFDKFCNHVTVALLLSLLASLLFLLLIARAVHKR